MADLIFIGTLVICGIVLVFAFIKLGEGLKMRRDVFSIDEEQVKAVQAASLTEIRSEESLNNLQNAIKPKVLAKLTSPASAILCAPSEMSLEEKEGKFIVRGYVDSQNGFGAMRRTNFRAKCVYNPKFKYWMVETIFLYE